MISAESSKFPVWFIILALLSLLVSATSSSNEGQNRSQPCVDGTYEHEGRNCCLCGAGLHLKEHCTTNLQFGTCETCPKETYSIYPNNQKSCEPCTSCLQPNANLEVEEPCTPARDTRCRCKHNHYCSSDIKPCKICNPCKVCAKGIKVDCTANSDRVCNDKTEGDNKVAIIVGIIVIVVVIGLAIGLLLKRRRNRKRQHQVELTDFNAAESQFLRAPVVDLQPHLPDIAEVIGWRDLEVVAIRSSIPNTAIEACKINHPHSIEEATLELLKIWVEKNGREASRNLVQILQRSGKRDKAEKVMDILSRPNAV
ncbi:tumor necrosis factor receptor superfamily member 23 isoform X2 [Sander lucioperca]|uniref:tumor necrosis factor receptor superfamily member 23 isoform X2 n=1 Tax=Sander lucioperca TaxID=283035 RepID=UPI00125E7824|nr:tumor necrosis factor receptor superfamily member 23 isoform X2 [Sander lucioperca]